MNRECSYWEEIYNTYGETEGWVYHECGYGVNCASNFCPECGRIMTGCKKDGRYTIAFDYERFKNYD